MISLSTKLQNGESKLLFAGFSITSDHDDPLICCYTSPIMRRAAALSSATEVVFVDSTSTIDTDGVTVTFMLTATQAGAVPLCVLLHAGQSEEVNYFGFMDVVAGSFDEPSLVHNVIDYHLFCP